MDGTAAPFAAPFISRISVPTGPDELLSTSARQQLRVGGGRRRASMAGDVVLEAFRCHPNRTSVDPASTSDHRRFESWLHDGGLDTLLGQHPTLEQNLDDEQGRWERSLELLMARLLEDRELLETEFGIVTPIDEAVPLVNGSFRLHAGGRTVIYKARSVATDVTWARLLDAIGDPALRSALTLARAGYGYVEFIPDLPPDSEGEVLAALHGFGKLVALTTVLGSADLHSHNVRFFGTHPVVLDTEVLVRPPWSAAEREAPDVYASGLLPTPEWYSRAGLASVAGAPARSDWEHLGSDAVRRAATGPTLARLHRRTHERLSRLGSAHHRSVLDGFDDQLTAIRKHGLPLDLLKGLRSRVLLRPSTQYEKTMRRCLVPPASQDASALTSAVADLVDETPESLAHQPVVHERLRGAETAALRELRFPRFTVPTEGGELRLGETDLGRLELEAPLERSRRFVAELTDYTVQRLRNDLTEALDASRHLPPNSGWRG